MERAEMIVQLVVTSGNRSGQVIPISTEKFIIGRATDCHLKPTSDMISRYHCAILVGSEVTARDLGSRNGVRINGEKITAEQKLNNGDKLAMGPLEFYVRISADGSESADHLNVHDEHLTDDGKHDPSAATVVVEHSL